MIIASKLTKYDAVVARELADGKTVIMVDDDDALLRRLKEECEAYDTAANGGRRMECWLIAEDAMTLWTLQTIGIPEDIRAKVDILATTVEDLIAKSLLIRLPGIESAFQPLDRKPIPLTSNSTVHLVVSGFSAQTEALVLNAALVAHYPNYSRDTRLRTRITIVDNDILEKSKGFLHRYSYLFENLYYRTLNLTDDNPECILHRPKYEGKRKDFVDIEWEFVNEGIHNDAIRQKLKEWSLSENRQLTIALCDMDQNKNVSDALDLPDEVYLNGVPVLCNTDNSALIELANNAKRYSNVMPFGKEICKLDTLRMLKNMAKRINYVYNHAFASGPDDQVSAPTSIDETDMDAQWDKIAVLPKVYSNIFNAMTLGTKMHSMGHSADDWEKYYALSREEIEVLMEVEHNRWNVEELILGYRPATEEEQLLIEEDMAKERSECKNLKRKFRDEKIHYDLRSFDDLRKDITGKNVNIYDYVLTQSIPLIIKTCIVK